MAVLPMKKALICGLKEDRKGTLEFLQRQEILEISCENPGDDLFQRMDTAASRSEFERKSDAAAQALAVLDTYEPEKKGLLDSFAGREPISLEVYEELAGRREEIQKTAERLLELSKEIQERKAELPKLHRRREALTPWMEFDLPLDFSGTKTTAAFAGASPREISREELERSVLEAAAREASAGPLAVGPETSAAREVPAQISVVSATKEQTCFFAVCAAEDGPFMDQALKKLGFIRAPLSSEIPAVQSRKLEETIRRLGEEMARAEEAVRALAPERGNLKFLADYYAMREEKYQVLSKLAQSRSVFLITGFVPARDAEKLERGLTARYPVYVEFTDPDEEEDVPVLLQNNKFAEPVEGIVESYSLPGKGEMDPTAITAPFYYVLFGLMLSDAAYGLIMVLGCAYCLKKFKNMEPGMRKTLKMFLYSGISTTFWGVLFGSFFGDAVNVIATTFFDRPDIRLAPLWFEPVAMPMKMLVFSFAFGIVHLFAGLGAKLYSCIKSGHILDGIYDAVFWYLLVGGAIVYILTIDMFTEMFELGFTLPASVGNVAAAAALVGLVGIILTNGRESKNWGKRIAKGLYGAYGITSYLSDILSYSRLLALGLATSVISTVFNQMGSMLGNSIPGMILFILVFVIGHALNLAINAMGAYVHTNRLQFVEFFGKFYEGGGRKFSPFAIHTKYFKVKEDH